MINYLSPWTFVIVSGIASSETVRPNLADGEAEDFLKIRRLADEEQVKSPATAEVGHDDGIDGHGGKETTPGSLEFLWSGHQNEWMSFMLCVSVLGILTSAAFFTLTHLSLAQLAHCFTDSGLDVRPLLLSDCGMFSRTTIRQQEPHNIPYDPKNSCLIKWQQQGKSECIPLCART